MAHTWCGTHVNICTKELMMCGKHTHTSCHKVKEYTQPANTSLQVVQGPRKPFSLARPNLIDQHAVQGAQGSSSSSLSVVVVVVVVTAYP